MIKIFKQPKASKASLLFLQGFEEILFRNNLSFCYINYSNPDAFWQEMNDCNYFIARWKGNDRDLSIMHALLPLIEKRGITTLPNFNTAYYCGDKYRLAELFVSNGIPTPKTRVFWTEEAAMHWIDKTDEVSYPFVAKLRQGASSNNVCLVKNKSQAESIVRTLFRIGMEDGELPQSINRLRIRNMGVKYLKRLIGGNCEKCNSGIIFQEFMPNNNYDTRITVIGNRAFGFRRINRNNDFRASGSGKIDWDSSKISEKIVESAFDISQKFQFQSMAYDFVFDKSNKPTLLEMNYTYDPKAVHKCHGYWTAQGDFVENRCTPQYWHLVDLLKIALI